MHASPQARDAEVDLGAAVLCPRGRPGHRVWEVFAQTHAALGPAARAHVASVVQTEVPEPPAVA